MEKLARMTAASDADLGRRTLRMVVMLVSACVLVVGTLSLVAVIITSKMAAGGNTTEASGTDSSSAKKPLSI